jgi:hypothetical protein
MPVAADALIGDAKHMIDCGDLEGLQELYAALQEDTGGACDQAYLFRHIYVHACLRHQTDIASWLRKEVFEAMDPIMQIGLRHIFAYGDYLLRLKLRVRDL